MAEDCIRRADPELYEILLHEEARQRETLDMIAAKSGIRQELLTILYKVLGAAYLGQLAASLCRDAGESALAGVLEFCTKMTILLLSLPLLTSLFDRLAGIAEGL